MLILLRRFLALVLVLVFLLLFVLTLLAFRINDTVLEADFYTDTLRELDFYNFLYDDAIPAALDDAKEKKERGEEGGLDLEEDLPLGLSFTNEEVVSTVKRVLPQDWLQANVEQVIGQAVPYVTGETDSFTITVPLDDRVETAIEVVEEWVRDAETYDYLMEDVVTKALEENRSQFDGLPYGLSLTPERVLEGIREVVPQEWLDQRIEEVVDEVTPYVTGKEEDFSILIPLQDRARAALPVLEGWLLEGLEGDTYDYLLEEQITPVVLSGLGSLVSLPFGITLTDQEVLDALAQVLPREWVQERVSDAFDAFGPYLIGDVDTFTIDIPLRDRMEVAAQTLLDATDAKFREVFDSLPTCTLEQVLGLELSLTDLPECVPPGVSYDALKTLVGLDVLGELEQAIVTQLPESILFTEADLTAAVGNIAELDEARDLLRSGLTFTDEDLRELILEEGDREGGQDNLDLFDDARRYLREGITVTEQDLRDEVSDDGADLAALDDLDEVRDYISLARSLLWVLPVGLAALLVLIGFLGGRAWRSRLGWAGVPLVVAGGVVAGGLAVGKRLLREFTDDAIKEELDLVEVFIVKLLEVQDKLIDSMLSPMQLQGSIALIVGVAMVAVGLFGPRLSRKRPQ